MRIIDRFVGEHSFLNNFHRTSLTVDGIKYSTAEHAYQAHKFDDRNVRLHVASIVSPMEAKKFGKLAVLSPRWDDEKVSVMKKVVTTKFTDPILRCHLVKLMTVDALRARERDVAFVNENRYNDRFWGTVNGQGSNHLGEILNEVLDEIIIDDPEVLDLVASDGATGL